MNLLSSEQALELINKARISSDPDVLPATIRQIQANALRYAVYFLRQSSPTGFLDSLQLQQLANQLDLQPPVNQDNLPNYRLYTDS